MSDIRTELSKRARALLSRVPEGGFVGVSLDKELEVDGLRLSLTKGGTLIIESGPPQWELVYMWSSRVTYDGYDNMVADALETLQRIMLLESLADV